MSAVPLRTHASPHSPWTSSAERLLRLVYRTSTAARQLRRLLAERVARWELSDSEMLILWLCWQPGKLGRVQGDLASALGISPAQTSALVEGLRKRGYLLQERSPLDRRRQIWRLSAEGESLLEEMGAAISDLAERFEGELTTDEHRLAEAVSERLFELLQDRPKLRLFDPDRDETPGQGESR
jgi:DNA-binding MarR family transcriptional regulator